MLMAATALLLMIWLIPLAPCAKRLKVLKQKGAKTITAYATHPILSGEALKNIAESELNEVVVTDTIPLNSSIQQHKKIRVLSLSKLIAETIMRVCNKESVSSMFAD